MIVEKDRDKCYYQIVGAEYYIGVPRCFKCYSFSNKGDICTDSMICGKCGGGDHVSAGCVNGQHSCRNCRVANEKFNLRLNMQHSVLDRDCPCYLEQVKRVLKRAEKHIKRELPSYGFCQCLCQSLKSKRD